MVHSPVKPTPFRAPRFLPAVRPGGRTDFPGIPGLFNDKAPTSPMWDGSSTPTPVPLPGLAVPKDRYLSAVSQQVRAPRPCFMPPPFRDLPSETSPHAERAPLSGLPAPMRSSTRVLRRTTRRLSRPVSPTPTLPCSCLVPPGRYGSPFEVPKHPSRSPWPRVAEPSRSASFTRFGAFLPAQVRSHRPKLPRTGGRSSLGLSPL